MSSWNLSSIPWDQFDPGQVDPKLLAQAKGASLVESNAADYVDYLRSVFAGDPQILQDIKEWGHEEELHGAALRKWCELADPAFDYPAALARFQHAYQLPQVHTSVRGSAARELVARCVVETGTTTYYTALRDAAREPVLREICRRIAGDEVRHFNLFLRHLTENYAAHDGVGIFSRARTVLSRISEVDDPELTLAHFAANLGNEFDAANYPAYANHYMAETLKIYGARHFMLCAPMLLKAIGVSLRPSLNRWLGRSMFFFFRLRYGTSAA